MLLPIATIPLSGDFIATIQQFFAQAFQLPANLLAWPVVLYAVIIPVALSFLGFMWLLRDFGFFSRGEHATTINAVVAAFLTLLSLRFIVTMSIVAYGLLAVAFVVWIIRKIAG